MTLRSPGRVLRTVRYIRPRQALAQLRYLVRGKAAPVTWDEPAPALAITPGSVEPFLPAPDHARFDGHRRIALIGREVAFRDEIDWDFSGEGPLWAYHLHQFDYARRTTLSASARTRLILDWIARHPRGTGWNPHPISLRILSWGKLLLTPGALEADREADAAMCRSLASQIETLAHSLEVRLQANHLFSNLLGVVFGGLLFQGSRADGWLALEGSLRREIDAQVHSDGGHEERSPMYHALLLENLLDLLNLARAQPTRVPSALLASLEAATTRMLAAMELWTHPDGEIALLSDSALGIAHAPARLAAYAESLEVRANEGTRESKTLLADTGILRLEAGSLVLIASVGGPAPAHQPGHAHCDALAFELSCEGQRVVTDTGVTEYIPGPLRDACRRTRAHATLEVGGAEQAEIWSAHRVGGRPLVRLEEVEPGVAARASCAGWSTPDTLHRRHFLASEDAIEIVDELEGRSRPVRFALPLAPGMRVALEPSSRSRHRDCAAVSLGPLSRLRIELPEGVSWTVESSLYFPRFGAKLERPCLVGEADAFSHGRWRFEIESSR